VQAARQLIIGPVVRAVVKAEAEPGFRVIDVPEPQPGRGEVLVRVEAASICGTDVHLYDWNPWAASRVHPPRVMGHEMGGVIEALGGGVNGMQVGTTVACESHVVCGHCPECLRGDFHVCANTRILGVDIDGVFAPRVVVPARNLWPTPPGFGMELAALMEPFGNAVHACSYGTLRGQAVAVFGCGPIGLAAIAIARAENAAPIVAVDLNAYRLKLAGRMGADAVVDAHAPGSLEQAVMDAAGGPVDCALEMSGASSAIVAACRATRPGGWVSLLGIGDTPTLMDMSRDVVMKGLTLYGITGRRLFSTWEATTAYLQGGRIDAMPLLTHHFALEDVDHAIDLMRSGDCGKVVLHPG
jgi:threonine 3-dehydrogenase